MSHLQVHQQKQQQEQEKEQQELPSPQLFLHQQSPRMAAAGGQKSVILTESQPDPPSSGPTPPGESSSQGTEPTKQFLGKRKIKDLISQLGFNGQLDPGVEDLLLEAADNFIDSVTTFASSLAKHRKSSILEAKDVLLHLERDWKLTIPGYSNEERKRNSDLPPNEAQKNHLDVDQVQANVDAVHSETDDQTVGQVPSNPIVISPSPPSSEQLVSQSTVPKIPQKDTKI